MEDIEKILKDASLKEFEIPPKVKFRIGYALNNKKKDNWRYHMKKLITVMASLVLIFVGGFSVYAAFGGTISGKPVIEWLGIKFSDQYEEYKVNVEGQELVNNETTIDLVSTACDDGYTIFEFDVKLSEKDKEYLRIGESIITEADLEAAKKVDESYGKEGQTANYDSLQKAKDTVNTIAIDFNTNLNGPDNKVYNIMIDNQGYWVKQVQTVDKISDYEYKIYQLYFLTDKELNGKSDFSVNLKNIVLKNRGERPKNDNKDMYIVNTPNNERSIEIEGEFNVELSKSNAVENTKIIVPNNSEVNYKNMTKKIDEVKITPLQIIVKVTSTIDNVSMNSLSNIRDKDYIGHIEYNVYDNNGEQLSDYSFEIKRQITYSNGKTEEWSTGDIGTYKDFENATMELTEYIIIEKNEDTESLKIEPFERIDGKEEQTELDEFNIDLK